MGATGILSFLPQILANPANVEMLLEIVERAPIPVAIARGVDHALVLANAAFRTLSNIPLDSGRALNARDSFPFTVSGSSTALLNETFDKGQSQILSDIALHRPGQGTAFFDVEFHPLLGAGGRAEAVLIVPIEVTEKRLARHQAERTEADLREHVTLLNLALDTAEMGEWDYDIAEEKFVRSPAVDAMFGFSPGEAGTDAAAFIDRIHEEDRESVIAAFEAARQGTTNSINTEYRVLHPDGEVRWLASRGELLEGTKDAGARFVGITMNITDRKNAEQALHDRETRFRELAEAMPQIVWSAGPNGHVDYFNRRSLEYTRLPEGGGINRSWRESMHPDDVQHTIDLWRHSVETGETYEIEYRFKEPQSGTYRWHLGRALPIRNGAGKIVRWLGTSTDIHDQKLAEQELAAALAEKEKLLDLKTSLLREINHRVKNSLQLVSSLLNLQGRNINDPEVRFRFDEATRRVLTVSRVHERLYETDNIDRMEFGQFLRDLCHDVAKSLNREARRHRLTIEAPEYDVLVDQAIPLALVVNELVTNAYKYAFDDNRTGEVRIILTLNESEIQLTVADNGRGLPPGFDVAKTRSLGMVLINALTRQLKGSISYEEGAPGATFVLTAPRIHNAEPGLRLTSARVPLPSGGPQA